MTFQKIICPLDFSFASYQGLRQAIALATPSETELCLLHVDEPQAGAQNRCLGEFTPASESERCALAITRLCTTLEEQVPIDLRSRPLLRKGEVSGEVLQVAVEEGADLIVLSAHGAGRITPGRPIVHYLLGSVVQVILRSAPCPVIVVNALGPEMGLTANKAASPALFPLQSLQKAFL